MQNIAETYMKNKRQNNMSQDLTSIRKSRNFQKAHFTDKTFGLKYLPTDNILVRGADKSNLELFGS